MTDIQCDSLALKKTLSIELKMTRSTLVTEHKLIISYHYQYLIIVHACTSRVYCHHLTAVRPLQYLAMHSEVS